MTTQYDYKLGRDIYVGATVPSPCEHERRDNCYWCTRAELERVKASLEAIVLAYGEPTSRYVGPRMYQQEVYGK